MPGKGFSHTPNTGEYRKYNSWGRTRQPKNIAGAHTTGVVMLNSTATLNAESGYATEGQRYLHLYAPAAAAADDEKVITVHGYVHAFGAWFVLNNAAGNPVTIELDKDNAVSTYTGGNTIDVLGVDRIAFKKPDDIALNAATKLMAAVNSAPAK